MEMKMRAIVFAYHEMGCVGIEALLAHGYEIVAVVTHADADNENVWFRSVAEFAARKGLPVLAPEDVNHPLWLARIRELQPEVLFSFYYRKLLSAELLKVPSAGCFNLHGSLLPKYRGCAPANWAILHGETQTGVTLHYMTARADAGDVVAREVVPIAPRETAFSLMAKLESAAVLLLRRTVPLLRTGAAPRIPQDPTQATTFGGRGPEDGRIDWKQSAGAIDRLVRAVTHPYPGAFTIAGGKKLFVWETLPLPARADGRKLAPGEWAGDLVGTGDGLLRVVRCQIEGERERVAQPTAGARDQNTHPRDQASASWARERAASVNSHTSILDST